MKNNFEKLKSLSQSGYEFALRILEEGVFDGRHELEGGAYANVMTYETKTVGTYEAHREYIDVQIILSGREVIAVETVDAMRKHRCLSPYGEKGDIEIYEANEGGKDFLLERGDFLILMPSDAHMPGVAADGTPETVHKAVIKIPVA